MHHTEMLLRNYYTDLPSSLSIPCCVLKRRRPFTPAQRMIRDCFCESLLQMISQGSRLKHWNTGFIYTAVKGGIDTDLKKSNMKFYNVHDIQKWAIWLTNDKDFWLNSITTLISGAICVSSPALRAREFPGFGLTGKLAEIHLGFFHYPSQILSDG